MQFENFISVCQGGYWAPPTPRVAPPLRMHAHRYFFQFSYWFLLFCITYALSISCLSFPDLIGTQQV
ncbi:hypothetical protein LINPERPRIM_LOCUS33420 [Linum perenne]